MSLFLCRVQTWFELLIALFLSFIIRRSFGIRCWKVFHLLVDALVDAKLVSFI